MTISPNTGMLPPPGSQPLPPFSPAFFASLPGQVQIINNLVGIDPTQLAALNTAPVVDIPLDGGVGMPSQPRPRTPATRNLPPGLERRIIDIPPLSLTSLVKDEVVTQIVTTNTVAQVEAAVRTLGLTLIASENLAITQSIVMRFRITDGRTPQEIIRALASIQLIAVAQPNYIYTLQQQGAAIPRLPRAATPARRATRRNTSWRNSRFPTSTAWSGAPMSRSR